MENAESQAADLPACLLFLLVILRACVNLG